MRRFAFFLLFLSGWSTVLPLRADDGVTVLHYVRETIVEDGELIRTSERTINIGQYRDPVTSASPNSLEFDGGGYLDFFDVAVAAPIGEVLKPGDYLDTTREPFQKGTHPGLSISYSGSISEEDIGGNTELGQFHVWEIAFDANGKLLKFAADFAKHDDGNPAGVYGQIRYHSSVPYTHSAGTAELAALSHRVFQSEGALTVSVLRSGSTKGPLSVNYSTVDSTALAGREYAAASGTLTWADGDKKNKTFTVPIFNSGDPTHDPGRFFVRLDGADTGGQSVACVQVINDHPGDTLLHFQSDVGDYVGQGMERFYSPANEYAFTVQRNASGGVTLFVDNTPFVTTGESLDDEKIELDFAPPAGTTFGVGDYLDTQTVGRQKAGHPGFSYQRLPYGGNSAVSAAFQVLEAEFDDAGNVLRFAADFTAQYKAGTGVPAMHGQIRYHSSVPLPSRRLPQVGVITLWPGSISESSRTPATMVLTRTGSLSQPLTVVYKLSGDAVAGRDYHALNGVKKIPANRNSVLLSLQPIKAGRGYGRVTAKLVVKPQAASYDVGNFRNTKLLIIQGP